MKKLTKLDWVLLIVEVQIIAFTVTTIIIYTTHKWQFDTLVTCFLGIFGGIEPIIAGAIQIGKYKHKKKEDEG